MWGMAVHWAKRHFRNVVFYGDETATGLLVDGLGLPFDANFALPFIPDSLDHVRDLVKLHALREAVLRFGPAWHHDHDAHFHRRPSDALLAAPFVCEFRYAEVHNPMLFQQVRDFNATLPVKFPNPQTGLASGIMGGTDVGKIVSVCEESVRIATCIENRPMFAARELGAGYWKSVLIGEMTYGTHWPNATGILADGGGTEDDRRKSGWWHIAGGKENYGLLAIADNLFRDDFPHERSELFRRWRAL